MPKSSTIAITGGAGFIGSHLADVLIARGNKVIIIDNLSTGSKDYINKQAFFFKTSITNSSALRAIFKKHTVDTIFHLAAQTRMQTSIQNTTGDARNNILGTINILNICKNYGIKHLIFSSTCAVYSEKAALPTKETAALKPPSPYALSKLAAENYIHYYSKAYGINSTILRFANVYGPRQSADTESGVVAIFIQHLLRNKRPIIFGDGRQTRDYVYVKDVTEACIASRVLRGLHTINIGTGKETSVNALYDLIKKMTNFAGTPLHKTKKAGDRKKSLLDPALAHKLLGWKPRYTLQKGLRDTIQSVDKPF